MGQTIKGLRKEGVVYRLKSCDICDQMMK